MTGDVALEENKTRCLHGEAPGFPALLGGIVGKCDQTTQIAQYRVAELVAEGGDLGDRGVQTGAQERGHGPGRWQVDDGADVTAGEHRAQHGLRDQYGLGVQRIRAALVLAVHGDDADIAVS